MQSLVIFEKREQLTEQPVSYTITQDNTRSDKVFLNKLYREARLMPFPSAEFLDAVDYVATELSLNKSLAKELAKARSQTRVRRT